jgi:hypothetical protein
MASKQGDLTRQLIETYQQVPPELQQQALTEVARTIIKILSQRTTWGNGEYKLFTALAREVREGGVDASLAGDLAGLLTPEQKEAGHGAG